MADFDIDLEEYVRQYALARYSENVEEREDKMVYLREDAEELVKAASSFPVGMLLERRELDIQPRPALSYTFPADED